MELKNLSTLFTGNTFIELQEVDSTNTFLLNLCREQNVFEGTTVFAHKQTLGRGQRGNVWKTDAGKNIICSILLMPEFLSAEHQFELNKAVSLGICDAVKKFVPTQEVKIKWPNDIYVGNKKISGVLIENLLKGTSIHKSIIGIGLNVNQDEFDAEIQNATSLKALLNKDFGVEEVLLILLECIEKRYLQLRANQTKTLTEAYLQNLYLLEQEALFIYEEKQISAKIKGITKQGKLKLLNTENYIEIECGIKELEFVKNIEN